MLVGICIALYEFNYRYYLIDFKNYELKIELQYSDR